MKSPATALLLAAALALPAACGKKDEAAPAKPAASDKPATPRQSFECSLELARKDAPKYVGDANGPDEKAVEAAAWEAACAKIPEAERAGCKDQTKFTWSAGGGSIESGGKKTFSTTITLTQVMPSFPGKGTSETSEDEACAAAIAQACKAAGAPAGADCTAGGEWVQKNIMKHSTRSSR